MVNSDKDLPTIPKTLYSDDSLNMSYVMEYLPKEY